MVNGMDDAGESFEGKTMQPIEEQPSTQANGKEDDDESNPNEEEALAASPRQSRRRQWLFLFSCLNSFFFVGSFFGYGPMQIMLERNAAFDWKCENETPANGTTSETTTNSTVIANQSATATSISMNDNICSDQTAALLNVNLIATTTQIASPLLGHCLDKYGPQRGAYVLTFCLWSGLALLTIASTRNNHKSVSPVYAMDRLLYVSFALLALGTWMGGLLTVQVGLYFTGHTRSRVIFILNALFDAGSVVYLLIWLIMKDAPVAVSSLTVWMGGFLGLGVLIMSGSLYFWTVSVKAVDSDDEEKNSKLGNAIGHGDDTPVDDKATRTITAESKSSLANDEQPVKADSSMETQSKKDDLSVVDVLDEEVQIALKDDEDIPMIGTAQASSTRDYIIISERSHKQQLTSKPFLLLCVFFSIQCVSNQWNLSTMREFLAHLGDDDYDNRYLTIFTLLLPAGIISLPLVDAILLYLGFSGAFQCINALAIGYTLVKVCSDSLSVQIVGFCLFALFRCLLFGIVFSYLPVLLAGAVVGKAAGIMFALTGLATFVCVPLAQWAVKGLDGNFLIPNVIFCVLVIPCIVAAHALGLCMKREDAAKEQAREDQYRAKHCLKDVKASADPET